MNLDSRWVVTFDRLKRKVLKSFGGKEGENENDNEAIEERVWKFNSCWRKGSQQHLLAITSWLTSTLSMTASDKLRSLYRATHSTNSYLLSFLFFSSLPFTLFKIVYEWVLRNCFSPSRLLSSKFPLNWFHFHLFDLYECVKPIPRMEILLSLYFFVLFPASTFLSYTKFWIIL